MSFTAWFSSFTFGFISIILLYVSICSVSFFKVSSFFLSCQNNLLTEWFFLFHFSFNAVSQALLRHFGPDCWRVWAVLCIARCFTATLVSAHPSNWNDQKCFQTSSNVPPGGQNCPLFPVENHFSNDEFSLEILTYLTYSCLKLMFILFWNTTRILKHLIFNFSTLWALPIVFKTQNTWLLFYITDICLDLLMYLFVSFLYFFLHIITSIWEWFPSA